MSMLRSPQAIKVASPIIRRGSPMPLSTTRFFNNLQNLVRRAPTNIMRRYGNLTYQMGAMTVSCICLGICSHKSSSSCAMEARQPKRRPRRPPKFGTLIPSITSRGIVTKAGSDGTKHLDIGDSSKNREDCPLCKKFGSGPCGEYFYKWLSCTEEHPGKDEHGEPLHLAECLEFAQTLAECLEANAQYYNKKDVDDDEKTNEKDENLAELKKAWEEFASEMENGIDTKKYSVLPFPEKYNVKMDVRLPTKNGAAYFASELEGGFSLVAAYILSDRGDVLAAGSREDMDMGNLGCILQFDLLDGMKSATCRAIYDRESDPVTIYSRTLMVPRSH